MELRPPSHVRMGLSAVTHAAFRVCCCMLEWVGPKGALAFAGMYIGSGQGQGCSRGQRLLACPRGLGPHRAVPLTPCGRTTSTAAAAAGRPARPSGSHAWVAAGLAVAEAVGVTPAIPVEAVGNSTYSVGGAFAGRVSMRRTVVSSACIFSIGSPSSVSACMHAP